MHPDLHGIPETELTRGVRRTVLDNGLTLLTRRLGVEGVVALQTYVGAGYTHEEDEDCGLAHLLEHMWFKGSAGLPEEGALQREIKALGGMCNAGTIYDHTHYYFVLPSAALATGVRYMADAFATPLFDAERMAREVEVIIEESNRKKDRPAAWVLERMLAHAFTTHRIRRWRIGSDEVLRAATRDRVVRFHQERYRPENMVVSIAGDIDHDAVIDEVRRGFGVIPRGLLETSLGPDEPAQTAFRWATEHGDVQHAWCSLGFRSCEILHEDDLVLDVIGALLASGGAARLSEHAVGPGRFKGLSFASNLAIPQVGSFILQGMAAPSDLPERSGSSSWRWTRSAGVTWTPGSCGVCSTGWSRASGGRCRTPTAWPRCSQGPRASRPTASPTATSTGCAR